MLSRSAGMDRAVLKHHAGAAGQRLPAFRIERDRGYPARSAKVLLRVGLDQIRHLGLLDAPKMIGKERTLEDAR